MRTDRGTIEALVSAKVSGISRFDMEVTTLEQRLDGIESRLHSARNELDGYRMAERNEQADAGGLHRLQARVVNLERELSDVHGQLERTRSDLYAEKSMAQQLASEYRQISRSDQVEGERLLSAGKDLSNRAYLTDLAGMVSGWENEAAFFNNQADRLDSACRSISASSRRREALSPRTSPAALEPLVGAGFGAFFGSLVGGLAGGFAGAGIGLAIGSLWNGDEQRLSTDTCSFSTPPPVRDLFASPAGGKDFLGNTDLLRRDDPLSDTTFPKHDPQTNLASTVQDLNFPHDYVGNTKFSNNGDATYVHAPQTSVVINEPLAGSVNFSSPTALSSYEPPPYSFATPVTSHTPMADLDPRPGPVVSSMPSWPEVTSIPKPSFSSVSPVHGTGPSSLSMGPADNYSGYGMPPVSLGSPPVENYSGYGVAPSTLGPAPGGGFAGDYGGGFGGGFGPPMGGSF